MKGKERQTNQWWTLIVTSATCKVENATTTDCIVTIIIKNKDTNTSSAKAVSSAKNPVLETADIYYFLIL